MKIIIADKYILKIKTKALVVGVCKNERYKGTIKQLNDALGGAVKKILEAQGFDGSLGQSVLINHTFGKVGAEQILLVGLGERAGQSEDSFRKAGTVLANELKGRAQEAALSQEFSERKEAISPLIQGINEGSYEFLKYKTGQKPKKSFEKLVFVSKSLKETDLKREARLGEVVSDSVRIARNLVNEPPVYATPERLAQVALEIAEEGGLQCEVFDRAEIVRRGMGGLEAVSRGSDIEPRFIHLTYRPESKRKPKKRIAIAGKGITFDSGGLCIKPADGMRTMKMDMAGSAVVLGVMKALSYISPNIEVHGLISASENMTGAKAYKPDDVIRAYNGKTIEVINTDAEGRIVLSDALSYAVELGVDEIVDLATLTGACMVGLGSFTAGVMGNDQRLVDRILKASSQTGEKMWQLPMDDELRDEIKSTVADMKNAGTRMGGAIIAAMLLEQFVSDTPWVHIDIAGPAYSEKKSSLREIGGTGFGINTMLRYLVDR